MCDPFYLKCWIESKKIREPADRGEPGHHLLIGGFPVKIRDVAQSGSALAWGARGRGFKSRRPD
jgi:hypothetical protein